MNTEFGKLIHVLRIKKNNITQDEMARDLGCSASLISTIVNGKTSPDLQWLVKCPEFNSRSWLI
jgi:DNA-binding XRE family transcriptional regulator